MERSNFTSIKLAVVDDHRLFRRGLINLIASFGERYEVILEANNGKELLIQLQKEPKIDIAIIDINMPIMNGFETASELVKRYEDVKVLVVTMVEDEQTLIRMLRCGIRGYLTKDVEPEELKSALDTIASRGYYYTDHLTGKLISAIQDTSSSKKDGKSLNERKKKFLQLACSEYTYKEIADVMNLSIKTVDGYRHNLFEKINVKSRVGLVLYAIKNNLVSI